MPLFALGNAGIVINGDFLAYAYTTPITLGVIVAYLVGKPIAVVGTAWLLTILTRGRIRPPVGWAAVTGSGTIAGIGFTVSLLIASLAFDGEQLDEAKLGALTAAAEASVLKFGVYRITALLPRERRIRALLGRSELLQDLVPPVDSDRDHIRGPGGAWITLIEYGDFECPNCGQAESVVRDLRPTPTCNTYGDTYRCPTSIPRRSSLLKLPKQRGSREPSGRCMICCWRAETICGPRFCLAMQNNWGSIRSNSTTV